MKPIMRFDLRMIRGVVRAVARVILRAMRPKPKKPIVIGKAYSRVLQCITDEPRSARKVAELAGVAYSSRFRQMVADLLRAKKIVRAAGGLVRVVP